MNHLGDLHFHGRGVVKDSSKAKEWWEKAAAAGHLEAKEGINNMAPKSIGDRLKLWVRYMCVEGVWAGGTWGLRQWGWLWGWLCVCVCVHE